MMDIHEEKITDIQEDNVLRTANMDEALSAKKEMKKVGVFFLVILLLEIPLAFLVAYLQRDFFSDNPYLISILITQGYLLICALLYILITKKKFTRDLQLKKYKLSTFFLSLLVLLTAAPMASFLNVFSQLFAKNTVSLAIFEVTESFPWWLGILIIGCLPGFIEETIYRGIIYQAFKKRSILTGIIVSALSFGLMHMNFNQILYAVYLGVLFAFVLEATGSLGATMILHMIFNGVNTAYLYILPKILTFACQYSEEYADVYLDASGNLNMENLLTKGATKSEILISLGVLTPMAVGGLVLTILLIILIAKINQRDISFAHIVGEPSMRKTLKPVTVCLILGWVFCLVYAVMEMMAG